jgi:hypothetical protein
MTWRYLSVSATQAQPCPAPGEEIIADIDNGLRVEDEGLAELIGGSGYPRQHPSQIVRRLVSFAAQALERGLVAGFV